MVSKMENVIISKFSVSQISANGMNVYAKSFDSKFKLIDAYFDNLEKIWWEKNKNLFDEDFKEENFKLEKKENVKEEVQDFSDDEFFECEM
jgi:hypothetical protein